MNPATVDVHENEDGSIVDMLLADVRSGFSNKKYGESNFSVTKIQKVALNSPDLATGVMAGKGNVLTNQTVERTIPSVPNSLPVGGDNADGFVRGGFGRKSMRRSKRGRENSPLMNGFDNADSESTCSSLDDALSAADFNQRRSRRSNASSSTDDSLFDLLMHSGGEESSEKSEGNFERYGSLQRRRRERRDNRGTIDSFLFDRERASSPVVTDSKDMPNHSNDVTPKNKEADTNPDVIDGNKASVRVRRTRSLLDKRAVDIAVSETKNSQAADTNAIVERAKARLQQRSNRAMDDTAIHHNSVNLITERKDIPNEVVSVPRSAPERREVNGPQPNNSRWRNNIIASETPHNLQSIDEKSRLDNYQGALSGDKTTSLDRARRRLANRFSVDPNDLDNMLKTVDETEKRGLNNNNPSMPDKEVHRVSVSVRSKINRRWHSDLGKTDIDEVLKAIEDSEKTIGDENISERIIVKETNVSVREPYYTPNINDSDEQSSQPNHLTVRRQQRRMRSQLSLDDVHKALEHIPTDDKPVSSTTTPTNDDTVFAQDDSIMSTPPSRRSKSFGDHNGNNVKQEHTPLTPKQKKEESRAAKLAGKRRFRAERFGDKESPQSRNGSSDVNRCRSNVEKEDIDRAFKDMVNQGSMSRSKSYDEAVSRKALCGSDDFIMNKNTNSCSAPDNFSGKSPVLRTSTGRLSSSDSRRYGCYIPSEDSDSEVIVDNVKPRRKSNGSADTSLTTRVDERSSNASTETLRDENHSAGDSSPEQSRRDTNQRISSIRSPQQQRKLNTAPAIANQSLEARSTITGNNSSFFGDDDSPHAMMNNWRKRRESQRRGHYDVNPQHLKSEHHDAQRLDNVRHDYIPTIIHRSESSSDSSRCEPGSRCSVASSDRDEGFETQSGTTSQRTSLSSTYDSELYYTPTLPRKTDIMKYRQDKNAINGIHESVELSYNDNSDKVLVNNVHNALNSVKNNRKQRTESWTEYTVLANASGNINKDSSLDSSMEYTVPSHEELNNNHGDRECIDNAPSLDPKHSNNVSINKSLDISNESLSKEKAFKGQKTIRNTPSYMRGTTTSSKKSSSTNLSSSDIKNAKNSSPLNSVRNVRATKSHNETTNLNKSKSGSANSLVSAASSTSELSSSARLGFSMRRSIAGKIQSNKNSSPSLTNKSRVSPAQTKPSGSPHNVTKSASALRSNRETPQSTSSGSNADPKSNSLDIGKGLSRTQSLRAQPGVRRSAASITSTSSSESKRGASTVSKNSPRLGFMKPTSSSRGRIDAESSSVSPAAAPVNSPTPASPLKRYNSLRLPSHAASRTTSKVGPLNENEKTSGTRTSRLSTGAKTPSTTNARQLSTVVEQDQTKPSGSSDGAGKDKGASFLTRMGIGKAKERSISSRKSDTSEKKKVFK